MKKQQLIEEVLRLDGNVMTSEQIGIAKSLIRDLKAQRDMAVRGLEKIANDPYKYGQRIQSMKRSAAETLAKIKSDEWVG